MQKCHSAKAVSKVGETEKLRRKRKEKKEKISSLSCNNLADNVIGLHYDYSRDWTSIYNKVKLESKTISNTSWNFWQWIVFDWRIWMKFDTGLTQVWCKFLVWLTLLVCFIFKALDTIFKCTASTLAAVHVVHVKSPSPLQGQGGGRQQQGTRDARRVVVQLGSFTLHIMGAEGGGVPMVHKEVTGWIARHLKQGQIFHLPSSLWLERTLHTGWVVSTITKVGGLMTLDHW